MEQISVQPTQWQVDEGEVRSNETGQTMRARMVVFSDPTTNRVFVFPMPLEEAKQMGEVLAADDAAEAMQSVMNRRQLQVGRQPSEDEIARVAKLKDTLEGR